MTTRRTAEIENSICPTCGALAYSYESHTISFGSVAPTRVDVYWVCSVDRLHIDRMWRPSLSTA